MKKIIVLIVMNMIVMSFAGTSYKNGEECNCDSIHKEYYSNGSLWSETPFKNGKQNGIEKGYYKSGAIIWERPYVNGKQNGIEKAYYESGAIYWETLYVNGKRNGIEKWYYESGKLAGTAKYKNNTLVGYKQCTDGRKGNEHLNCLH